MENELKQALLKLQEAHHEILKNWSDELEKSYPYKESFDELSHQVDNWVTEHLKTII